MIICSAQCLKKGRNDILITTRDESGKRGKTSYVTFFVLPGYILEWRRISTFIHQRLMGWILVVLYFYDHCRVSCLSGQNVVVSFSIAAQSQSRPRVLCSFVVKLHSFVF